MRSEVFVCTLVILTVSVILPILDGRRGSFRLSSRTTRSSSSSGTRSGWWRSRSSQPKTQLVRQATNGYLAGRGIGAIGGHIAKHKYKVGAAAGAAGGSYAARRYRNSKRKVTIILANGTAIELWRPPLAEKMQPFFYGKQTWSCLKYNGRRKRSVPVQYTQIGEKKNTKRSFISISHGVLLYRGLVFDFENDLAGEKARIRKISSFRNAACKITWNNIGRPTGWSGVSEQCIRKCVASWKVKHWDTRNYVFWWHKGTRNSNTFTRKVAEILWYNLDCPAWCG